jgi:hypothetical protein
MFRRFLPATLGLLLCLWATQAFACGFGTDIGGGVCRGFLTTTPGSNQTFPSPADWNNSNNSIEAIGGGGSGAAADDTNINRPIGAGGGGGEWRKITNFSFAVPGTTTATYQLGLGGTAVTQAVAGFKNGTSGGTTWFNSTVDPGAGADNTKLGAKPGLAGNGATGGAANGGAGGTGGWGTSSNAGGRGGNVALPSSNGARGTGGGGAAGSTGVGVAGTDLAAASTGTSAGGNADTGGTGAGTGGAGGNPPVAGGPGTESDGTHGSGGGGGAGLTSAGGAGGNYGGGGGGGVTISGSATSGAGIQGMIVITYTPVTSCVPSITLLGVGCASLPSPARAAANDNAPIANDNERVARRPYDLVA